MDKETLVTLLDTDAAKEVLKEQFGIENLSGLVTKNKELLNKVVTAQEELNTYRKLGEVDKIKSALELISEQEVKKTKEVMDSSDAVAKEKHLAAQLDKYKNDYEALQKSLVSEKTNMTLTEAILKAKGDPEILIPLLSQRVKAEYDNGKVNIAVYEDGQIAHRNGERMSVNDLVEEAKAKHPNLFEMSASGAGVKPGSTRNTPLSATLDFNSEDFNMTKAAERIRKTGTYESVTKRYGWR